MKALYSVAVLADTTGVTDLEAVSVSSVSYFCSEGSTPEPLGTCSHHLKNS
jgi:hypothetical protein